MNHTENRLYPLKFIPIFKDKVWGGQKMKCYLHKDFSPLPNCGESWELSGMEDAVSVVEHGFLAENDLNELIEIYMDDLVGDSVFQKFGLGFPLLIKWIDAADALSVQVHPDDDLAQQRHGLNGKSELWHVVHADPGAGLYVGLKPDISKADYLHAVSAGNVNTLLQFYPVTEGDTFYIPAGTLHAIGKGVLLAEIQEASDITYRVFDWNRKDEHGLPRELHLEEAVDAIHFNQHEPLKINYKPLTNQSVPLLRDRYFNINYLHLDRPLQKNYTTIDSFVIYMCTAGEVHFLYDNNIEIARAGDVILKPAIMETLNLVPVLPSTLLEVYV
ncbi:MAG: class I mannose-6-phosphate isomerase [Bacteroidales bacterium]|jgi:mannose-6-phosphate isomerase|nr:class I mannose-6-phosphate isomerase [Bacteroidales bacterium]